jgi:hypothetical protein
MGSGLSGLLGRFAHLGNGEERLALQTGLVVRRLGAIATVLRAAACFDREQGALLNIHALLVLAMNGVRLIEEFKERETI